MYKLQKSMKHKCVAAWHGKYC